MQQKRFLADDCLMANSVGNWQIPIEISVVWEKWLEIVGELLQILVEQR